VGEGVGGGARNGLGIKVLLVAFLCARFVRQGQINCLETDNSASACCGAVS